jgi:O-antigen ligase
VAALAVLLYAAWETDNRIVWIALGAQLVIAAMLHAGEGARTLRRIALVAAVVAILGFAASVAERSAILFAGAGSTTESLERDVRPRIWGVAWHKFKEAPWVGHGFGREILAEDFLPQTPTINNHPPIRHGHNVFVDVALQLGVAGLAVFGALLVLLGREYARYLGDPRIAALGGIGLMLLAGFVLKNLTDDFLHRHNALVFWALNGMLLGAARAVAGAGATPPGEAAPR